MKIMNTNISSKRLSLALVAIAMFIVAMTSCGKSDKDKAAPEMTVTIAQVKSETVPLYLDYVGTLQSIESVDINARVEGFLVERAFKDGADVKQGDLLFVIDPRPFDAALIAAEAQLAEDLAALSYAREQVSRYKPLVEKDYITKDAYDEYRTQAAEAQAVVEADRANVVQAKLNLSYCTMFAPFDGRIGRRLVDVGNLVGAGGEATLLATIVQLDPIYVYFNVAERDIPQILKQQNIKPLTFNIVLPDESKHPEDGTVDFVDNQVDVTTGTITLRGIVSNTSKTVIPGQYVKVQLLLEEQPNTLVVPSQAIGEQQGDTYVYVVGNDNKVEFRNVTAGSSYGELRVIEKGVKVGEKIVVNGLQKIKPGVTVKTETQAEAAAKKKATASPKT
ncbi:MAG: efflux RND transporter periplasmic adaptor subunit, partial [Deltaproteobacteria bacterium]|nr:efflux RND transporter periplasmic adaptor subunit [Deltaproteobacteria bacterium]